MTGSQDRLAGDEFRGRAAFRRGGVAVFFWLSFGKPAGDGTDGMPYRTEHGSHYHMTEGCCGATMPCDAAGLAPCSICCGGGGASGAGQVAGEGAGESLPKAATPADDPRDGGGDGSVIGILGRLRAWAGRHANPTGAHRMPLPPSRRTANFTEALEEVEQVCDELMRDAAARRFPQQPRPDEERFLSMCLARAKAGSVSDVGFARRLAESSTVIVQWATSARPMPHRAMGAQVALRDVSPDGRHPVRSATITAYSLLEAPPDLVKRGIPGIGCKAELRCENGRIEGIRYQGIDSSLWGYGDASLHVSLVPISGDDWRLATSLCDAYERDGDGPTSERRDDGVGTVIGKGEIVGSKASGTPGCDDASNLFLRLFESGGERLVELDSFEIMPQAWNRACDRMSRHR